MTDLDLARQLVAHPRWRWACGMAIVHQSSDVHGPIRIGGYESTDPANIPPGWLPVLADDATAGVLLGMLRSIVPSVAVLAKGDSNGPWWRIEYPGGPTNLYGDALGHAAARALLALWGQHG